MDFKNNGDERQGDDFLKLLQFSFINKWDP